VPVSNPNPRAPPDMRGAGEPSKPRRYAEGKFFAAD
jgi:hypothetical protein